MERQRPRNQSFLFADLAGYTTLTEAQGDEHAADAAAEFCAAVRRLLEEHGAEEVKAIGDAMLLRVDDPDQAVRLAARTVTGYGARHLTLGIRVGVHTGTAVRRGENWFGSAVNLASRVADLGARGPRARAAEVQERRRAASRLLARAGTRRGQTARRPGLSHGRRPTACRRAPDGWGRRLLHLLTRMRTRLRSRSRPLHQPRLIPDPRPTGSSRQRPAPTGICAAASASDAPVRSGPRVLLSRRNRSALL